MIARPLALGESRCGRAWTLRVGYVAPAAGVAGVIVTASGSTPWLPAVPVDAADARQCTAQTFWPVRPS